MVYRTLIDADVLKSCLGAGVWRVFDCRCSPSDPAAGRRVYLDGHIPGARHADLDQVLAAAPRPGSGRHPLPDRATLGAWLGGEGVGADTQIVAYDDAGGAFAARLWWLARWLGHRAAAVLDGGLTAWRAAGGEVEEGEAAALDAANFPVRTPLVEWLDTDAVLAIVQRGRPGTIVDARSSGRYRGDSEPIDPVAGHIPRAVNRPFSENLDSSGRFLAPRALRKRFEEFAQQPATAVHYCGSGVTACHNLLAMEHAGLTGSRLYPGSWSEWVADPARPVTRGGEDRGRG